MRWPSGSFQLESQIAVPAFGYGCRDRDAFRCEIVAHGLNVGRFEGDFDEAVLVFRFQSRVDLDVLMIVDLKPGGGIARESEKPKSWP
jgi:hypothetical protein